MSQQAAEEKCNCFADLVHVPTEGEFLVRNGEVLKVIESDYRGPDASGEDDEYVCYVERKDDESGP